MKFLSQAGLDRFLFDHFFRGKRNGVFVDVGAFDGERFNDTVFFERVMGWSGLCIEPAAGVFSRMALTRGVKCEQVAIGDFEGMAEFVELEGSAEEKMQSGLAAQVDAKKGEWPGLVPVSAMRRQVMVKRLATVLEQHQLVEVDFCSLNVGSGEAALSVLAGLDGERFRISVFAVKGAFEEPRLRDVMGTKGYDFVAKVGKDFVFKRRGVKELAQASVICAVWHKDPKRRETLRGHTANLARQSVPVESIYVFDGGDEAPAWLEDAVGGGGHAVAVREALTIYQAWNVALSLVATPLVMNLNLDDRLAPEGVELLQQSMLDKGVIAVGGEWHVRFSQEETDAVLAAYPAERLPYLPAWPPVPGSHTRLGSGTGERPTFGPATMWRMEAHWGAPRFPWRMEEGTLIKAAGDLAWWNAMENRPGAKLVHLPIVIGNYHSHPGEQAEFRLAAEEEARLMRAVGVSLL